VAINPIAFARTVNEQFLRYQLTVFPITNEKLAGQAEESIRGADARPSPLIKGPYLSLAKAFLRVQHRQIHDPETGGSYTVKRYRSGKAASTERGWQHTLIRLEPLNKDFLPILLGDVPEGEVQVIAEFLVVLAPSER
jgi:hypothetical protein